MTTKKHSCSGKQLLDQPHERTATCYECGRTVKASPVPMDVSRGRWLHPAGIPRTPPTTA